MLRRCCCTTLQRPHTRYSIHACLQRLLPGQARKPSSHRSSREEGSFLRSWYIDSASLPGISCSRLPLPAVYPNSCKPSKSNAHPTAALDSFRASNSWRATTPRRPGTSDRDLSVDHAAVILLEQKSNPPTASVISFWGLQCGSPPDVIEPSIITVHHNSFPPSRCSMPFSLFPLPSLLRSFFVSGAFPARIASHLSLHRSPPHSPSPGFSMRCKHVKHGRCKHFRIYATLPERNPKCDSTFLPAR